MNRVLCAVVASCAVAGGLIHVGVIGDHLEHPALAAGFGVMAAAQFAVALGALVRRTGGMVAAAAVHAGILGIWVASRTTGLPVAGAREAAPVGVADAVAQAFSLGVLVAGGLWWALGDSGRALVLPAAAVSRGRQIGLVGTLALLAPALAVPHDHAGHVHGLLGHGEAVLGGSVAAAHDHERPDGRRSVRTGVDAPDAHHQAAELAAPVRAHAGTDAHLGAGEDPPGRAAAAQHHGAQRALAGQQESHHSAGDGDTGGSQHEAGHGDVDAAVDDHHDHGAACDESHPAVQNLVASVRRSIQRSYPNVLALLARGYFPYYDAIIPYPTPSTRVQHWLNPWFFNDGDVLNPDRPEGILLDEWFRPIGFMFISDIGKPGPPVYVGDSGAVCRPWHPHEDGPARSFYAFYRVFWQGRFDVPEQTPEMMHVWVRNRNGVFSAHDYPPPEDREGYPPPLPWRCPPSMRQAAGDAVCTA